MYPGRVLDAVLVLTPVVCPVCVPAPPGVFLPVPGNVERELCPPVNTRLMAHARNLARNNGASPFRHRATAPPANSTHAAELSVATDPVDPLGKR